MSKIPFPWCDDFKELAEYNNGISKGIYYTPDKVAEMEIVQREYYEVFERYSHLVSGKDFRIAKNLTY